jgi:hypothetical protein
MNVQKPLFLNELSFSCLASDNLHACRESMSNLIKLTASLNLGSAAALGHIPEIWTYDLAKGYNLSSWVVDNLVKLTERTYLRTLLDRGKKLSSTDIAEMTCNVGGRSSIGFLYTYIESGVALSILSAEEWDIIEVDASFEELDATSGEIKEYSRALPHISQLSHVDSLKDVIFPPVCEFVNNASDLLAYLDKINDNVIVCEDARAQIENMTDIKTIRDLAEKIDSMNAYINELGVEPFDMSYLKQNLFYIRPDTPHTLTQYRDERTFRLPDQSYVTFSWHFDLPPAGSCRGYIHWCSKSRKVYVGYVGKHLNTKKHKA